MYLPDTASGGYTAFNRYHFAQIDRQGVVLDKRWNGGGSVTAPRFAIFGLEGKWGVENVEISPDVTVDLDPRLWRQGHDARLEKAVEVALAALAKSPLPVYERPPYPNHHPKSDRKPSVTTDSR